MTDQMELFDCQPAIVERFWKFHDENPHVYKMLVREGLKLRAIGHKNYGIGALFEVLRWHRALETTDISGLKLSNDYRAMYARLIDRQVPELEGFFRMKKVKWGELG